MAQHRPLDIVAGTGPGLRQVLPTYFERKGYNILGLNILGLGRTQAKAPHGSFQALHLAGTRTTAVRLADVIGEFGSPSIALHSRATWTFLPPASERF